MVRSALIFIIFVSVVIAPQFRSPSAEEATVAVGPSASAIEATQACVNPQLSAPSPSREPGLVVAQATGACGLCSQDSDCGVGWKCCRDSSCTTQNKTRCMRVATCP